jgi:small subunit ribosomal protein S7
MAAAEKEEVKDEPKEKKPRKKAAKKKKEEPLQTFLLFGRWDLSEVEVHDAGLRRYINLSPTFLPHTGGRWASRPFAKAKVNLVERLINNMMRTERYTGKKSKTIKVVRQAFELIEKRAKKNPVQVLVDALENAAPREEITRLRFGGISVPRAVDIAPSRRLDLALRYICKGAVQATYKNPKPIHECLASEILMAAKGEINSYAIGKKEEMERVAASAR